MFEKKTSLLLLFLLLPWGCLYDFPSRDADGPYLCDNDSHCAEGYVCTGGQCMRPGASPGDSAGSGDPSGGDPPVVDTTPPTVVSSSPAGGASNVSVNLQTLSVTFSEPMERASTEAAWFLSPAVAGTVSLDSAGEQLLFTPGAPLAYATTYTLAVSAAAKDAAGNTMTADFTADFVTEEQVIAVSGTVSPDPISVSIADATATPLTWGTNGDITVQLADPMDYIVNPAGYAPLVSSFLDVGSCVGTTCSFSFATVSISGLSIGLTGHLIDTRITPDFVTTFSGMLDGNGVAALRAGGTDYTNASIFAVSRQTAGAVGALAGTTEEIVVGNGFMLGLALDASGNPVGGVAINTPTSIQNGSLEIFYPTPAFDAVQASTSATGVFFAVASPAGSNAVIATFDANDGGLHAWPVVTVGTARNSAFFFGLIASN